MEDGGTVVAHSAGAAAVLKILALQSDIAKIGALHLVAAPYTVVDGEWGGGESSLEIDFADKLPKVGSISLYHSRDDEIVPFEHLRLYSEKLHKAEIVQVNGFGHQFSSERCPKLLDALKA